MKSTPTQVIARAIQATNGDDEIEGALLLGFVVVAEWAAPNDIRWLSRLAGTGDGERGRVPSWTVAGWLHECLHNWPEPAP